MPTAAQKSKPRFARVEADLRRQMLIDAAIRCLAEGGIAAFTVDRISREANVSRGLINHHFNGISGLLIEVYEAMTQSMIAAGRETLFFEGSAEERLAQVIETMFRPPMFSKSSLRAWLALWGEVATNPRLKASHRKSYDAYRKAIGDALGEIAVARKVKTNGEALAMTVIALIDGLWIEWCLDSSVVNRDTARAAVYDVLEARLGPLMR
ncbi:TetR family transcriptional regulator C-terminal domain-containing protein [Taklimakanibacter deserti]|uniref:TetR family transcriptional regulator C-terminal domain-containing protein n=1 Tax=Taklimakanibacter deserti TaxID=2267839 RepID=UPI000E648261